MIKVCKFCSKQFNSHSNKTLFCNIKCYNEYRSSIEFKELQRERSIKSRLNHGLHVGNYSKMCPVCKREFHTLNKQQTYCSSKCSAIYTNRHRDNIYTSPFRDKLSKVWFNNFSKGLIHLDNDIKRYIKTDPTDIEKFKLINKNILIEKSKNEICHFCGSLDCPYPEICHSNFIKQKTDILYKLGFDFNKYGTLSIVDEYNKLCEKLKFLYIDQKLSINNITKLYNIKSTTTVWLLLKFCNIQRRYPFNDKRFYTIEKNKPFDGYGFKHGYHITWNNKKVYYRSSYELDYCKHLDKLKLNYDMESINIPYFNTRKNKECIAIPDFYMPDNNLIIEIKSDRTYVKQDMIDRFRAYKKYNYDYKLILNKKDYGKRLPETKEYAIL